MTKEQFRTYLINKRDKLYRGDECEQEGAGEVQYVIDALDGKFYNNQTTLDEACHWVGETNLVSHE